MNVSVTEKDVLKKEVARCLSGEPEIKRVVIFGSFLHSDNPHDMDIAVFQNSSENYFPLAMKYCRMLEPVARKIALDVFPIRPFPKESSFLREIEAGEVVYER